MQRYSVFGKRNDPDGIMVLYVAHLAEARQARAQALRDAAKAMCGYCRGAMGHQPVPVKGEGWSHRFIVGNGSNPCAAGPIWDILLDWVMRDEKNEAAK